MQFVADHHYTSLIIMYCTQVVFFSLGYYYGGKYHACSRNIAPIRKQLAAKGTASLHAIGVPYWGKHSDKVSRYIASHAVLLSTAVLYTTLDCVRSIAFSWGLRAIASSAVLHDSHSLCMTS
jgi:hypothetical protein